MKKCNSAGRWPALGFACCVAVLGFVTRVALAQEPTAQRDRKDVDARIEIEASKQRGFTIKAPATVPTKDTNYAVPAGPVLYVAPDGNAGSVGDAFDAPPTLQHAVDLALLSTQLTPFLLLGHGGWLGSPFDLVGRVGNCRFAAVGLCQPSAGGRGVATLRALNAKGENSPDTGWRDIAVGDDTLPSLHQHPPFDGSGSKMDFKIAMPKLEAKQKLFFVADAGLKGSGAKSDGVVFALEVNGKLGFQKLVPGDGKWHPQAVDLSRFAGQACEGEHIGAVQKQLSKAMPSRAKKSIASVGAAKRLPNALMVSKRC